MSPSSTFSTEFSIVVVLCVALAGSWIISQYNGVQPDGSWMMHGFYNGDVMTMSSLVERSLNTQSLVTENPLAANGYLEYPTVLHGALASLLEAFGIQDNWQEYLALIIYMQLIVTVPMFFLLWDIIWPEPDNSAELWLGIGSRRIIYWLQAGIVLFIMMLSWDAYVYPQSHFFLMGLYLLLASLLVLAYRAVGVSAGRLVMAASVIGFVLLVSNAVIGTAAAAMLAVWHVLKAADGSQTPRIRSVFILGFLTTVLFWLAFAPGDPSFGLPQFSYTAAMDMSRLALVIAALIVCLLLHLDYRPFVTASTAAIISLAGFTFFFSTRDIIIENASRFLYQALLLGFPLFLPGLFQSWFWIRRELSYTARPLPIRAAGWASVLAVAIFFVLPALGSVAATHDNLQFKDEQRVSALYKQALTWIEDHAAADALFAAQPTEPWTIPFFTGRAIVRASEYWLSPPDNVTTSLEGAFQGDAASQLTIGTMVDYILLTTDEEERWTVPAGDVVFRNDEVVIFQR